MSKLIFAIFTFISARAIALDCQALHRLPWAIGLISERIESPSSSRFDELIPDKKFVDRLYSLPSLHLQDLVAQGMIETIAPRVYRFVGAQINHPHELSASARLARTLGQNVLLFGHLPALNDVPGVDGIVFSHDGAPAFNLSIKSAKSGAINRDKIHRLKSHGRSEMKRAYHLADLYSALPKIAEYFHTEFPPRLVLAAANKLLGILDRRPVLFLFDLSNGTTEPKTDHPKGIQEIFTREFHTWNPKSDLVQQYMFFMPTWTIRFDSHGSQVLENPDK